MTTSEDEKILLMHRRKSPVPGIRKSLFGFGPLLVTGASFFLLLNLDDERQRVIVLVVFMASMAVMMFWGTWWLMDGITDLTVWRKIHRGPKTAMRLSARGVEYSLAWRGGDFDTFVPWSQVTGTVFRPGLGPATVFCVEAEGQFPSQPEGPTPHQPAVHQVSSASAWAEQVAGGNASKTERATLANIYLFGTPLVINLRLCDGVDTDELDRRLQQWTHGRCRCEPSATRRYG